MYHFFCSACAGPEQGRAGLPGTKTVYVNSVLRCSEPAIQNSKKQKVNHEPCELYQFIYMVL